MVASDWEECHSTQIRGDRALIFDTLGTDGKLDVFSEVEQSLGCPSDCIFHHQHPQRPRQKEQSRTFRAPVGPVMLLGPLVQWTHGFQCDMHLLLGQVKIAHSEWVRGCHNTPWQAIS